MSVEHVKIHEVREDKPARLPRKRLGELGHSVGIVFRGDVIFHAAAVVNVVNLADAEDWHFFFRQNVQQHRAGRFHRVIVPPLGASKISGSAGERPGDDAAYAIRAVQEFARDLAHAIELGNRNHVFVRGDLKNAVAGGVHDGKSGNNVFTAKLFDNFGAGCGLVAERAAADLALEFRDQRLRKAVGTNGKSAVEPDAGHFPVAGGGV